MTSVIEPAVNAAREYAEPVRAAVEENIRDIRRAVVAARRAVEDCADETAIQVRRHPIGSLGLAVAIGTLFGCLIGYTAGRLGGGRLSR